MSDLQITIEKVRKLLELSKNNTNENEMKAAALAADKLMQQHRITQAQLEISGKTSEDFQEKNIANESGRRSNWREVLLAALCDNYGAAWYIGKNKIDGISYNIIAQDSDFQIVNYMYHYLQNEIERLSKHNCKGKGRAYCAAWKLGCAEGIFFQLKQAREAEKSVNNSTALVHLNNRTDLAKDFMYQTNKNLKKSAQLSGGNDYSGRMSGREVGKSLSINKGISAGKTIGQLK